MAPQSGCRSVVKTSFDCLVAAAALVVLSPAIASAALAVLVTMGRPIFFRQERPGRGGQPFRLVKLRTMTDARGPDGALLTDAQRITRLGRFLRVTSLDELPQLWNVLRGELSLVGPRPLLMSYLPRYTPDQARRHLVMPGITGWAQVSGRNALSWDEKFALDAWYVDHWSLWLDFKILLRTAAQVVLRRGISQPGHATMPEFLGTEAEMRHEQGRP